MNKTLTIALIVIAILIVGGILAGVLLMTNPSPNPAPTPTPSPTPTTTSPPATSPPATTPKTYNAEIRGFAFSPLTLNIKKGDKVIWTNFDSVGHTVTSDSGNELGSELLSKGETYERTFSETGTYNYHCTPHPNMKAKIIVE